MKTTFLQRISKLRSALTLSKPIREDGQREKTTIDCYIFCMAALALVCIPALASAQLTLDDYTTGNYVKHVTSPHVHDLHYGALPANSPLGAARGTYFGSSPNSDEQSSTLDVGKGHFVIDAGFGSVAGIQVGYGYTLSGGQAPLGLNLAGYSGFQLNFQGVASSEGLIVVITVWPHSGGYYDYEVVLPPNGNAFSEPFPFSGFNKGGGGGGLTQSDVSNIDFIVVQAQGGGFASFGLSSFQAVI